MPPVGFSRSANKHNVALDVLADWIEGSSLLLQAPVSKQDVREVLLDEQVYSNQDFAAEMVNNGWREVRRRRSLIGPSYPFKVRDRLLSPRCDIDGCPEYAFCLLLSYGGFYRSWAWNKWPREYALQGELFERLTSSALCTTWGDWRIRITGWSRTHATTLGEVVAQIASDLSEAPRQAPPWTDQRKKELGVDLLATRPFRDERPGVPFFLVQCASGKDWREKRGQPNLEQWEKLIDFSAKPRRGFAFALCLA